MVANNSYKLLDSGNHLKLELFGQYSLIRPALQAFWKPRLSQTIWLEHDGELKRLSNGKAMWRETKGRLFPTCWQISYNGWKFCMRPNNFGHLGIFPEQYDNWEWIQKATYEISRGSEIEVLNLFAYTGASTIAAAKAGAKVTHVDASKSTIGLAKQNSQLNQLDFTRIRWMEEDVMQFVKREVRRQRLYQGIICDSPTYGRGPKGQVWKQDKHFGELMALLKQLLDPKGSYLLLSSHSPGMTPIVMKNIVRCLFPVGELDFGEMLIRNKKTDINLPAGVYARLLRK